MMGIRLWLGGRMITRFGCGPEVESPGHSKLAPLTGSGASGNAWQGASVALSGDGNTAAIGGPYDDSGSGSWNGPGAVWIWTRSGSTWTQQGSKLVGSLGSTALQGSSVALSSDGNTLLVGGPADITSG